MFPGEHSHSSPPLEIRGAAFPPKIDLSFRSSGLAIMITFVHENGREHMKERKKYSNNKNKP